MTFLNEDYARELYSLLKTKLAPKIPPENFSIKERGAQSYCIATFGTRTCKIHCFDVPGPEYYLVLSENSQPISNGRTKSIEETLAVVKAWLNQNSINEIYDQFDFIDKHKRVLSEIKTELVNHFPELEEFNPYFKYTTSDFNHQLILQNNDTRLCPFHLA